MGFASTVSFMLLSAAHRVVNSLEAAPKERDGHTKIATSLTIVFLNFAIVLVFSLSLSMKG